jgi:hypothetical protein
VSDKISDKYPYCKDTACHDWELPMVNGKLNCETAYLFEFDGTNVTSLNATKDEQKLSLGMRSAWINFAYTGNPNKGSMHAYVIRPFPVPEEHFFSFTDFEPNSPLHHCIELSRSAFISVVHPAPALSSE